MVNDNTVTIYLIIRNRRPSDFALPLNGIKPMWALELSVKKNKKQL